jgi:hypothetical protein
VGRTRRREGRCEVVEPGRYDLILDPTNLWLTIHESIGHPTELDRAMGYEANYAGTSFVAPPDKQIAKLKYGTPIMNIQGDRTQEGSLARVAWDDEGVGADKWLIIDKGHLQGLPDDARTGGVDLQAHRREEVARLLLRRFVGQRAVPAHAERLAAAWRQGHRHERHRRCDGPRHHRQESRLVVDRSSADTTSSSPARCSTR